jgi:hypothetical protein
MKTDKNRELVTLRAITNRSRGVIVCVAIGLTICELLEFKRKDRVDVKTHPKHKNILLVEKTEQLNGYKLNCAENNGANFLRFCINSTYYHDYKLSQTMIAKYDIREGNKLIIDFSILKWKK